MSKYILPFLFLFMLIVNAAVGQTETQYPAGDSTHEKKEFREWDRLTVNLGYYLTSNSSGITLGSKELGLGLVINLEDAFGLETTTTALRANANYAFGKSKRHNVFMDYYSINRTASKTLAADIEIRDRVYPVGTHIDCRFNLSIIRAKYEYSFLQDKRVSLGVSGGFFIMPITFSLATTNIEGQSTSMVAPLPVVGLRSTIALIPNLNLIQRAELLYLSFEGFTGSLLDLNIAAEYKAFKHFGVGLGVNSNKMRIKASGDDYPNIDFFGDIKLENAGVLLYLSYFL